MASFMISQEVKNPAAPVKTGVRSYLKNRFSSFAEMKQK